MEMAGGVARAKEEAMRAGRFFEQKETKETKKNDSVFHRKNTKARKEQSSISAFAFSIIKQRFLGTLKNPVSLANKPTANERQWTRIFHNIKFIMRL
jgi:hypothetical protein